MGYISEGARIVFSDRRYWRYMVVPWMWSLLIFLGVVVLGYFALVPWIQGSLDGRLGAGSSLANFSKTLVSIAYIVLWFFIAGFVFLTITAITSSFLWDDLSRRVEESITGQPAPKCTLSNGRIPLDSVSRGLFAITIGIASLFCGWVLPIVGPVILAGWVGLLDYTSPAFLRYDRTVGQQWPVVTKMKGWFGFQIGAGFISLIPFLNVLLLPALVAGGTSLAVRSRVLEPSRSTLG